MNQIPNIEEGIEKILDITIEEWAVDICIEQEIEIGEINRKDLVARLKKRLPNLHQQLQKARESGYECGYEQGRYDEVNRLERGHFKKKILEAVEQNHSELDQDTPKSRGL